MGGVHEFDPETEISYADLQLFTNNFSRKNRIGKTQFGVLYRGNIPQGWRGIDHEKDVTVKMWQTESLSPDGEPYHTYQDDLLERMKGEIKFMSLPFLEGHQIVRKVEGYCSEMDKLGIVYDVKPLDTIYNIMSDADKFGWRNRVKVALALAGFLNLCHCQTPRYLVRNLSAEHVIIDQDFNPVIVDFAMIAVGGEYDGVKVPWLEYTLGSYGYTDDHLYTVGFWSYSTDLFTFGVILLELIVKFTSIELTRVLKDKNHKFIDRRALSFYEWEKEKELAQAKKQKVKCSFVSRCFRSDQYLEAKKEDVKCSFVNGYLRVDPDFDEEDGIQLTMLALSCVGNIGRPRKTQLVVCQLEKLHLVTKCGGML